MLAIFEYMSSDAIVLGNNTWPKVMGRDQNTFEEWDKEEITLRKLSVIDKMLKNKLKQSKLLKIPSLPFLNLRS